MTALIFSSSLIFLSAFSQQSSPDAKYKLLKGQSYVQSKNYYLLTLLQELPDVKKLLQNDVTLVDMAKNKSKDLSAALTSCNKDALCYTAKLKFSDDEIKAVGERLSVLYAPGNALDKLIKQHLIPSGTYILFQNNSPKDMLVKAWEQDARGINFAIGVYGEGKKPNYPLIDSISYYIKDRRDTTAYSNAHLSLLYNTASLINREAKNSTSFFFIPLTSSMYFLETNEREQAADFEPMGAGENKKAYDAAKTINWNNYKYSVILLPGAGPDVYDMPLSAEGMLRCRLSAMQYQNKMAPFIVVSGGKVHPYKTPYCEAIEMKKYLMEKLAIPESAIIIEPHARHTTTNMRNTVRIMYRNGIPLNKPGLTCTTKFQSNMIETTLVARCLRELNEAPYKVGNRLTETEVEFYPLLDALQIDPEEPMDP